MRICIDPGHGGADPGSTFAGGKEKDFTLAAAKVCHSLLVNAGHQVLATREDDEAVGLRERAQMANGWAADGFISLHWNASTSRVPSGTQVLVHESSDEAYRLAELMLERIAPLDEEPAEKWERVIPLPDAGYRSTPDGQPFVPTVLSATAMPAVLIEVEFGSNPRDRERMLRSDYQVALARAVVDGVGTWAQQRSEVPA